MKKISLFLLSLMLLSGCREDSATLEVLKRTNDGLDYKLFNEITDKTKADTAYEIIQGAGWENSKTEMSRHPEYRIMFPSKDKDGSRSYMDWVNGGFVELRDGRDHYAALSEEESGILLEIITEK